MKGYNQDSQKVSFFDTSTKIKPESKIEALIPILVNDKIAVYSCFDLILEPNTSYEIYGYLKNFNSDSKIFLSEIQQDKKLRDTILYTLSEEDFDANGNFVFPITFQYEQTMNLAVWTETGFVLSNLNNFYASSRIINSPATFKYAYKAVNIPQPLSIEESPETSQNMWMVNIEGKIDPPSTKEFTLNVAVIYSDGVIPEVYTDPEGVEDEKILSSNVLKGLTELDLGKLVISESNKDFQAFSKSLSYLTDAQKKISANQSTYSLRTLWGKQEENNLIVLWSTLNNNSLFTFEYVLDDSGSGNTQGSITPGDGVTLQPSCLAGYTLITMADGSKKRMDCIRVGDKVLAKDGAIDEVHTIRRGTFSQYHTLYYFSNGTIIDETHPHRFFNKTQGLWQRLAHWNIGDAGIDINNREVFLERKEMIEEAVENFGIFTYSGTYYANDLLSGRAHCNLSLLKESAVKQKRTIIFSFIQTLTENIKEKIMLLFLKGGRK